MGVPWVQTLNGFEHPVAPGNFYYVLGPFRGGALIREVGLDVANESTRGNYRFGFSVTGVGEGSEVCYENGRGLLGGDGVYGSGGIVSVRAYVGAARLDHWRLPLSVYVDLGAWYCVLKFVHEQLGQMTIVWWVESEGGRKGTFWQGS